MALSPKAALSRNLPVPESSLLSLLESVPALLWETDAELRIGFLTGAANSAGDSCVGRGIESLFSSPARAPKARHAHERALAGHAASFDAELNGRDLQANVKPLRDASGRIAGGNRIALDITDGGWRNGRSGSPNTVTLAD